MEIGCYPAASRPIRIEVIEAEIIGGQIIEIVLPFTQNAYKINRRYVGCFDRIIDTFQLPVGFPMLEVPPEGCDFPIASNSPFRLG